MRNENKRYSTVVVVGCLLLGLATTDTVLYVDLNVRGKVVLLLTMVNVRLNWKV